MTKCKKAVLFVLPLLLLVGIAALLFCYNQESFNGSRIKKPDAYLLDIEMMTGTDLHTMELSEGDVLQIQFKTEKGALYTEIKAPDGTTVYRGNGKGTTDFTVSISESGVYTIVVEARHAKGTIHMHRRKIIMKRLLIINTLPENDPMVSQTPEVLRGGTEEGLDRSSVDEIPQDLPIKTKQNIKRVGNFAIY